MAELLQQLVTRQAERRPYAIALVMNDERIRYAELEETSNQLARQLQAVGCVRGDRVCFLTPKRVAAIISELGILKADCIYVPLDPSNPAPRLAKIIAACEPRCVLVAGSAAESLRDALAEANLSAAPLIGWWDAVAPSSPGLKIEFSHSDTTSYERIYKTGDLAKIGEDGLVYFLGRADSQIKSRGYRIELGEIEMALNALGLLRECAIVAVHAGGFEGATICCAYAPLPGADSNPTALRHALSKALPSYMLPSRWKSFDRLPQNGNGKIDRRALQEKFQQI